MAEYSIRKTYGRLLDMFENAFTRKNPLFTLPMYYPLAWYKGTDKSIDPFEENRQKQVVGLIRTNFLKRFESSVVAFELSCDRLLQKLLAFLEVHSETGDREEEAGALEGAERRDPWLCHANASSSSGARTVTSSYPSCSHTFRVGSWRRCFCHCRPSFSLIRSFRRFSIKSISALGVAMPFFDFF